MHHKCYSLIAKEQSRLRELEQTNAEVEEYLMARTVHGGREEARGQIVGSNRTQNNKVTIS